MKVAVYHQMPSHAPLTMRRKNSTSQHNILPLLAEDIPAVAAIEASLQAFPWTAAQFAGSLQSPLQSSSSSAMYCGWKVCISEHQGQHEQQTIVAYAVTMQVLDEISLLTIGVQPAYQRHGIASQLLTHIIDNAQTHGGAALMLLEVRRSNRAAQAFYRRIGFVQNGVRRNYYPAPDNAREDAILMALTLDEGGR